jgi:hypothetical protein
MQYAVFLLTILFAYGQAYAFHERDKYNTVSFYRYGTGISHKGRDGYGGFNCPNAAECPKEDKI